MLSGGLTNRSSNAEGKDDELAQFWKDLKAQEDRTVERLKQFVASHVEKDCF